MGLGELGARRARRPAGPRRAALGIGGGWVWSPAGSGLRLGLVSGWVWSPARWAVRAGGGSGGWGTVCCGCGRRGDLGPRGSRRRAGRVAARSVAARPGVGGPRPSAVLWAAVLWAAVLWAAAAARDSWAGFAERERTAGLCSSFYEGPGGCRRPGSSAPASRGREKRTKSIKGDPMQLFLRRPGRLPTTR